MIDTDQLIIEFIKDQDVEECTKSNYRNILNIWSKWLIVHGISFIDARKPHVIKFKNDLYSKNKSVLTINTYLSTLKKFYAYLDDSGQFSDIANGVKGFKKYSGFRKKPLSIEQIVDLIQSIKSTEETGRRDSIIIHLMLLSGLRCVEVSRLNISDFKVFQPRKPFVWVLGKGAKEKTRVPITQQMVEDIEYYLGDRIKEKDEPIFIVSKKPNEGDRLSSARIGKLVKARMKAAGINDEQITAHSLRHTHAVLMIKHGRSLYEVQASLRHTNTEMTKNYLRFLDEEERINSSWLNELEDEILRKKEEKRLEGHF